MRACVRARACELRGLEPTSFVPKFLIAFCRKFICATAVKITTKMRTYLRVCARAHARVCVSVRVYVSQSANAFSLCCTVIRMNVDKPVCACARVGVMNV